MGEKKPASVSIKSVSESSWKALSGKRIYFGHQSVGFNIMEGIDEVTKENPQIKIKVIETNNSGDFRDPVFAHSKLGKNMEPRSKCDAFEELIESGLGGKIDIAFFKFCFVDITAGSDVEKVFSYYRDTIDRLKKKYPKITFIHMTVPLTIVESGIKAWVKKIIGKSIDGYDDNAKRNLFNNLIRREYHGKEPIFDLAEIESTLPNGGRVHFKKDSTTYYALVPQYTNNGGHLNQEGRKLVAKQLLILLSNVPR